MTEPYKNAFSMSLQATSLGFRKKAQSREGSKHKEASEMLHDNRASRPRPLSGQATAALGVGGGFNI